MLDPIVVEMLKILIPLVVVPMLGVLAAELRNVLRERATASQQETIKSTVETAVTAAEQLWRTNAVQDRYTFALQVAQDRLRSLGIQVSDEDLRAFIEAQVLDLRGFLRSL